MIIYKTTNLINNKVYVGQSKYKNFKYFGSGKLIKKAIKKYGINNFKKEILEECKTKEELDKLEIYYINKLRCKVPNGYNISKGGNRDFHNENTSLKISKSLKGRHVSEETKKKISLSTKGKTYEERYGKNLAKKLKNIRRQQLIKNSPMKNGHTEESKLKISNSLKGHPRYETQAKAVSEKFKGKKKTKEHRKNLSLSKMSLTFDEINNIRKDFNGGKTYKELSVKYNINYIKAWRICNGKYIFEKTV